MAPNWRTEPQVSGTADCTEAITGSNHQIGGREGRLGPVTAGRTTTVSARAEPPVRTPPYIGAGLHLVIAWRTTGPPLYCGRRVAKLVIAPRTTRANAPLHRSWPSSGNCMANHRPSSLLWEKGCSTGNRAPNHRPLLQGEGRWFGGTLVSGVSAARSHSWQKRCKSGNCVPNHRPLQYCSLGGSVRDYQNGNRRSSRGSWQKRCKSGNCGPNHQHLL